MVRRKDWLLVLATGLVAALPAVASLYDITDLGTLDGPGSYSYAYGLNDNGDVVGTSTNSSGYAHPYFWSGGTMTDLASGTMNIGDAFGINNSGDIVGWLTSSPGADGDAFVYSGGTMNFLGAATSGNTGVGTGINGSGTVAGWSTTGILTFEAWSETGGTYTPIGPDLGGSFMISQGINDSGTVVGWGLNGSSVQQAWSWSGGALTSLGTLGGSASGAFGINNAGVIIGEAATATESHAFSYSGGTMTDLGTLGGSQSTAYGLNEAGDIVGGSWVDGFGTTHAFLYSGGSMVDLNTMIDPLSGWTLVNARDVNNNGQIVGYGSIGGETHAFLLTLAPVPEPATCCVLLFGCGWIVRRRPRRGR